MIRTPVQILYRVLVFESSKYDRRKGPHGHFQWDDLTQHQQMSLLLGTMPQAPVDQRHKQWFRAYFGDDIGFSLLLHVLGPKYE